MDAQAWDERYGASGMVWSTTPNQFVAAEVADLLPGRALDLAAGEGRNAIWLAEQGWRVTAVDFSQVGLDKGRALARQRGDNLGSDLEIDWVRADALTYESGPDGYDLALLAYLQLAEDERRTAVRRAFGALRVGGTFLLVAHDTSNLTEGTGGPTDAAVLYSSEDVLADLDGERFEVERAERVGRTVLSDDDHGGAAERTAYDCLVRVVRTV
jgi:SAM-dependent methyltransferase